MPRIVASVAAILAAGVLSAQQAQAPLPRFRAGVDVVEIDVSVLDRDHKPVRSLKAGDFTVREDGVTQKIVAFDEVYSAPPPPPSAPWIREIPKDVETNMPAEHNLFVIIIDDALMGFVRPPKPMSRTRSVPEPLPPPSVDVFTLKTTTTVARRVVEGLRDDDQATVIFTWDNSKGVNFTNDRSKLLRAISATTFGPEVKGIDHEPKVGDMKAESADMGCSMYLGSAQALLSSVEALGSIQHRRKTVFYTSRGLDIGIVGTANGCIEQAQAYVYQAMVLAQRTNVNVYTLDPAGLRASIGDFDRRQIQFLQEAAENTGGRAIINTNTPEEAVPAILAEARAYYLIGYELAQRSTDEKFHRIEVKVNRPGLEVHTKTTRFDPIPESDPRKIPPALESSVGGFLPNTDVRLGLTTASFANPDGTARVVLGLTGQLPDPVKDKARDDMSVAVRVFTTDGRAVTSVEKTLNVALVATADSSPAGLGPRGPVFALSTDVSLKPGPYALRIGAHSQATDKTGSIYTDIIVPDFQKEALSLSGVILTASTGSSIRGNVLAALEPTAERTFDATNRIQAFLRIYQGGSAALVPVTMRVRLVNDRNVAVFDRNESLPAPAFARSRQADYFVRLPLETLKPGEYWLPIQATGTAKAVATRNVRFSVR
jgi:VWFA-related protein